MQDNDPIANAQEPSVEIIELVARAIAGIKPDPNPEWRTRYTGELVNRIWPEFAEHAEAAVAALAAAGYVIVPKLTQDAFNAMVEAAR